MTIDMSPEAISRRLERAFRLTELCRGLKAHQPAVEAPPTLGEAQVPYGLPPQVSGLDSGAPTEIVNSSKRAKR